MAATIQQLTDLGYSIEFLRALNDSKALNDEAIDFRLTEYCKIWVTIPLAPRPDLLEPTKDHVRTIENLQDWANMPPGSTWPDLVNKVKALTKNQEDLLNPYGPNWFAKTDDSQNPWTKDNRGMDSAGRTGVGQMIIQCCPTGIDGPPKKLFTQSPTDDLEFMTEMAASVVKLRALFVRSLGKADEETKDPLYKWAPSFVPLAGLGMPFFRSVARRLQEYDDWQHWAEAPDEEIYDDIIEARNKTGFPAGLYWPPFVDLFTAIRNQSMADPNEAGKIVLPTWFAGVVGMHILKHARFWPDYNGQPYISVMFAGTRIFRPVKPDQVHTSLTAPCNRLFTAEMCQALHLPYNGTNRGREWYHDGVTRCLQYMQIEYLPRARELRSRIHFIPPPAVTTYTQYAHVMNQEWVRPGMSIDGVSGFDLNTGRISNDIEVPATDVVALKWPYAVDRPEDTMRHRSLLPDRVDPEPASNVILRRIKNLNPIGNPRGLKILLDAVITADLLRTELLGSAIGNTLPLEYPLIFILPTGATEEETTNQGKTTAARVIGSIIEPNIDVHIFSPVSSAPAQRSMSMPIEQHGTTILDEYSLPRTPDHFLSQSGLQALATGGIVHPGRAMENCPGVRLAHPLFFTAKFSPKIPDIMNRMLPIFLDQLTAETKLGDVELAELMSGKLGILARLSHLLWLKKTGLLQLLRMAALASGEWRFNGHMGVANILAMYHGGTLEDVNQYLREARKAMLQQQEKADQTGLSDSVMGSHEFDPKWYWEDASSITLHGLELMCRQKGCLHVTETLRLLVEDGERRVFSRQAASCNTNEKGAAMKLAKALKNGPYTRADGWILERVATDGNTRNTYLRLRRLTPPPPPPPLPPPPPPPTL